MMAKKIKLLWVAMVVISAFMLGSIGVQASEYNFAVSPVIPDNQLDKSKTYFDILMKPGSTQTLELVLRNDTEQDVVVSSTINAATTNLNGVVEYGENNIVPDASLAFDLKKLTELSDEVTIPKKSEITLPIKVQMPKESFDGVIAGGITLKEKVPETKESEEKSQSLAIKNEFSYVIGIVLSQNENPVLPDLTLLDVGAGQVNYRNVINVSLQNPNAAYLNQLRLVNEVTKKGETEVLYSADKASMQMAPNSNFAFPIALNGQKLEAGDYHLKTVAYGGKNDDGEFKVKNSEGEEEAYKYKWVFEKDFTITGEVAKELNKKDVTIEEDYTWLWILIGILLLLLVLLILFLYRRKKKKDEEA